eukprot:228076-Pyramimonas_sp.AAC.1
MGAFGRLADVRAASRDFLKSLPTRRVIAQPVGPGTVRQTARRETHDDCIKRWPSRWSGAQPWTLKRKRESPASLMTATAELKVIITKFIHQGL